MTIAAIIIVKNEEGLIQSCLQQLNWVDQLIVVDNGSTDGSVAIAKKFNAEIIQIEASDFARLRNEGAKKATTDWMIYIDCDEYIPPALEKEIRLKTSSFNPLTDPHAYFLERENYYLGMKWPHVDGMIRCMYKPSLVAWDGALHESAKINGPVATLQHKLIHHTHRSLEQMLEKTNEWSAIEAELRFSHNHPKIVSWRLFRVFFTGFIHSYLTQSGWKAGTVGVIESIYQGFSLFITYAKLWELQQKK